MPNNLACLGAIMIWECISASGVGEFDKIDGIINAEKCCQIVIFHHDNGAVTKYLDRKTRNVALSIID